MNEDKTHSNQFSTTWSYTTSAEPARAGAESDVFVVPNLSVMYTEVDLVYWDKDKCKPELDDNENFPTSFVFDISSENNQPAFSFYSRYHLKLKTIPDLNKSIDSKQKEIDRMGKEPICCESPQEGSCLDRDNVELKLCEERHIQTERKNLEMLRFALRGWERALDNEKEAKEKAINDGNQIAEWFSGFNDETATADKYENLDGDGVKKLTIENHSAALAPKDSISNAKSLNNIGDLLEGKEQTLDNTMRVQIAGDSGMYEISLRREGMSSMTEQNCDMTTPVKVAETVGGIFGAAAGAENLFAASILGVVGGLAAVGTLPITGAVASIGASAAKCNHEIDINAGVG